MYYRGAAAALVVYDITVHVRASLHIVDRLQFAHAFHAQDSFTGAKTWIEELQRQGSADIVIGLAGNKCDLESKREVPEAVRLRFVVFYRFLSFCCLCMFFASLLLFVCLFV